MAVTRHFDEVEHSRRRFLSGAGVVAGALVAGHALSVWGRPLAAGAATATATAGKAAKGRTVVFVELAGGNDAIDTLVPYTDPQYRRLRPTLAVDAPIDLDGAVGLHPGLVALAERYRAGQVAVIEGVGYPDNDLSHFASLANWWSAEPGSPGATGWLGRYLDRAVGYDDPLAGVVVGPGPSPALVGERSFATSISDTSGLAPRAPAWLADTDDLLDTWARMGSARSSRRTLEGKVRQAIALTDDARADLDRALRADATGDDAALDPRADAADVSDGSATDAFAVAARLVTAPSPPRVVYLTRLGDYDTHQGSAARRDALMTDLDTGLGRFLTTVEAAGRADDVIVVTLSEFGRRAQENGSGTDHGNAGTHFVIGARVTGGRYGAPTTLSTLDSRGNLPFAVDFRQLYATALGWLDADPEPILGKGFTPQPVFTT
ncbi:MAG: DUF1501 domain-containing protein [Actinobacteria bacterium]|nr:DUF1501 domain-containing protein [Actinomycetota bacterium]